MDLTTWLSFPYMQKGKTEANDISSGIDKIAPSSALSHLHLRVLHSAILCATECWGGVS